MKRTEMINVVGNDFNTTNIEGGEYSYVKEAGSKDILVAAVGHSLEHFKLDIRFEKEGVAVLIETKQKFVEKDQDQLLEYVEEEKALHKGMKIIAILANTTNDDIKVWKDTVDDDHVLKNETVLDCMDHYVKLFDTHFQNDRETVLKNTYALNELLHKCDIPETLRSQFVGTTLLYIKEFVKTEKGQIDDNLKDRLNDAWKMLGAKAIIAAIEAALDRLLDGSDNKAKKIELLRKNVLTNQKVVNLSIENWIKILDTILVDIYKYINADSSEGQDILNMFFIAFNKYTGRSDKNQAFTPDHITEFMCRITDVDRTKIVLDATCGSGSFLVQAMVKEFADCRRNTTDAEANDLIKVVKEKHIYGIESEEKAFGLATTNMLIHGDGNSNIRLDDMFKCKDFIKKANPDIILMNPPYNAKPLGIPDKYKKGWPQKAKDGKEDPTKGFVFIQFISDVVKEINKERLEEGKTPKYVKLAVLLPVSAAIGTSSIITESKKYMLQSNRLEAVFTLPEEIFYPGASVNACCMVFTLGQSHKNSDGTIPATFFGYYKTDGFKKKKNLGRVEQFDNENNSIWKEIENKWIKMFRDKDVVDGLSSKESVTGDDEWLCEAYMKTDYTTLTQNDFQQTINNYLSFLIKEGKVYES